MKKDKKKIINEALSDEYLRSFVLLLPPQGEERAFHILTKAYRALRPADFQRFIPYYLEQGFPTNPRDREGIDFLSIIKRHKNSSLYVKALSSS